MLGISVRYLLKHPRTACELAADPLGLWARLSDAYLGEQERRGPSFPYEHDDDWDRRLHELLGVSWPCEFASEFWDVWHDTIAGLETRGVRPGPESFRDWNDGDAGFVRTTWCLVRHLKLKTIVETGVGHGVTSRVILQALKKNTSGHLWSIDLQPIESYFRDRVGLAVDARSAVRWSYIKGTSRRFLPGLLANLGRIDLFVHDSLHTGRNVRFELGHAWPVVRAGGAMVVDDIDANWGFRSFTHTASGHQSLICEAEPIHADLRRFNHKGLFGIILKEPTALSQSRPRRLVGAAVDD
jgi:hypothetical protein